MCKSLVRMLWARAAPSVGSVPAPSSSNSTRSRGLTSCIISTMFVIWPEKVLRLCSMLCSSPMSANTCSNTASSVPRSAGTWSPAWAISVNSPTVFRVTVLPPVFGPVMIRVLIPPSPIQMLEGTTFSGSIRGCRPRRILSRPSQFIFGLTQTNRRLSRPLAKIKSSSASSSSVSAREAA